MLCSDMRTFDPSITSTVSGSLLLQASSPPQSHPGAARSADDSSASTPASLFAALDALDDSASQAGKASPHLDGLRPGGSQGLLHLAQLL